MSDRTWIQVAERLPQVDEPLWYFFEITGIGAGTYYGAEEGLPTFGGDGGFLGGDVTHWMPRAEGDPRPAVPAGYTRPERYLTWGATLPYDEPELCHTGNRETMPVRALDWAHAAARGVFEGLDRLHDVRWRLRQVPDVARPPLVAVMSDGFRRAAREDQPWDQAVQRALATLVAQPVARELLVDLSAEERARVEPVLAATVQVAHAHAAAYDLMGAVSYG